MPTKVLDVEFEKIPDIISGLDGYERAMVLVRIGGRPVERVYVPVLQGYLHGNDLRKAIVRDSGRTFWQFWLGKILSCPIEIAPDTLPPPATIAICTRDRAHDLEQCLEVLTFNYDANQDILVVDSCSSNVATKHVVDKFPCVRYTREEFPGLDRARNRAMLEAKHDIVAFIDDDAVPEANWLEALTRNFQHPNVACVTGLTMPIELETVAQESFEEYSTFSRGFEHKIYDWSKIYPVGAGFVGVGANMALRRSVLELVGPFDEALDAGTSTYSGGDTEMFSRLLAAGFRIVYEPAALNWHCHRRTWKELRRTIFGYGVGIYSFWTRRFLFERDLSVVPIALNWLIMGQFPTLIRALFHLKGAPPFDLIFLEILGCLAGPWLYLKSRRQHAL